MPESKIESKKTPIEAPSLEEAAPIGASVKLPTIRHRARAGDLLTGDYINSTGHRMKVERIETGEKYAFTVKDGSDAVILQTTAKNFTDMSMTIEVWRMSRVEPSAIPLTEEML